MRTYCECGGEFVADHDRPGIAFCSYCELEVTMSELLQIAASQPVGASDA